MSGYNSIQQYAHRLLNIRLNSQADPKVQYTVWFRRGKYSNTAPFSDKITHAVTGHGLWVVKRDNLHTKVRSALHGAGTACLIYVVQIIITFQFQSTWKTIRYHHIRRSDLKQTCSFYYALSSAGHMVYCQLVGWLAMTRFLSSDLEWTAWLALLMLGQRTELQWPNPTIPVRPTLLIF